MQNCGAHFEKLGPGCFFGGAHQWCRVPFYVSCIFPLAAGKFRGKFSLSQWQSILNRASYACGPTGRTFLGPAARGGGCTPMVLCSLRCFLHYRHVHQTKLLCISHFFWVKILMVQKVGPSYVGHGPGAGIGQKLPGQDYDLRIPIMSIT